MGTGVNRLEIRIGLTVALAGLVAVLDTTIVAVAMPALMSEFDASITDVSWISSAYTLALLATMPLAAGFAERWGARRVYIVALAGFAVASAGAGLAGSLGLLIAARVVQGLAGGLITPLGMTIGFGAVPSERRARMTTLTGIPLLVGPILGPLLGGLLLGSDNWRAIFYVTIPPALLAAAGVLRWVPADLPGGRAPRLDLLGAALLVPGAVAVAFATSADGESAGVRWGVLLAGSALVTVFVSHALAHPAPLLRVRLLADPMFGRSAAVLALYAAPYFGSMLLMPTYVQMVRGDSAMTTALLMVPSALAMGLSLQIAARVMERFGATAVVGAGLTVAVVQSVIAIIVLRPDTPYPLLGLLAVLQGAATGAIMMPTMASATRNLQGSDLASGSAILPLVSTLANGMGIAAVTALFAVVVSWRTDGGSVDALATLSGPALDAAVQEVVNAQRLTQVATLAVTLTALIVRLGGRHRIGRRTHVNPAEHQRAARDVHGQ